MPDDLSLKAALRPIAELPTLDGPPEPGTSIYDRFRELRRQTPLVRTGMGVLALRARHADILLGPGTRQLETETKVFQGIVDGPIYDFIAQVVLFSNGEAHVRRRTPIARTFAFKLVEALRPRAAALAGELIEPLLGRPEADFLNVVAAQIPARMIAEVLGIPTSDLPVFMRWIADTSAALGWVDPERRTAIEASLQEFNAYVDGLLADRRARPQADFLSDYVAATAASGDLTEGEIRAQIVGLILAGSDTTRNALCMILARLLDHPEQWRAFCADPDDLKRAAVDEGMRFEPVVPVIPRLALQDLEIDGWLVPAGSVAALSILSALRDPDAYARPDEFDIFRPDPPRWHLAFGAGAHRCVGEALARVELEEALVAIARLAPGLRVLEPGPRLFPGAIRNVDQMRVALDA